HRTQFLGEHGEHGHVRPPPRPGPLGLGGHRLPADRGAGADHTAAGGESTDVDRARPPGVTVHHSPPCVPAAPPSTVTVPPSSATAPALSTTTSRCPGRGPRIHRS